MRQVEIDRGPAQAELSAWRLPDESVRLPIHFFAIAIGFFALGTATAPWAVGRLADYLYQLPVLAWVHTFTLGWITSAMIGVMYRCVPAIARKPLRFPRIAALQLLVYFLGTSGVVAHFMLGSWDGVWMAAAFVVFSVILLAINLVPCLAPNFGRGAAETGMLMAIFFLIGAGTLGGVLAFDKGRNFMPGDLLTNLSAHAHLAALGWVALVICAVSYRFTSASVMSSEEPPRAAIWQMFALAAVAIVLTAGLLMRLGNGVLWAVAIGLILAGYVVIWRRIGMRRSTAADWSARHALAAMACLLLTIAAGIALAVTGAGSSFGNHLAGAYGVLGLLGWISNFIVGMSYQLCAELVTRARSDLGWPHIDVGELSIRTGRPLVFWALNSGVLLTAGGLLANRMTLAVIGASLIALAGLMYSAAMAWTLSFAYRRRTPPQSGRVFQAAGH